MTSRYKPREEIKRCLERASQKYHSEVKVVLGAFIHATNCHFWYVLLNVTDAQVDFSYCNTPSPSYNSCTALRHKQNINKSRPKPSGVLLLDVSYTLGSNLLLQVAPYKPSVPSQVSHIKKTKPLRMEVQQVVFFLPLLPTLSRKHRRCSSGWWNKQENNIRDRFCSPRISQCRILCGKHGT